jgi:hypothetical protein
MGEASRSAHQLWSESSQRFDYFVTGISIALVAYLAPTVAETTFQHWSGALQPLALFMFFAAAALGLKGIENSVVYRGANYEKLIADERTNLLFEGLHSGSTPTNPDTDSVVPLEQLKADRNASALRAKEAEKRMRQLGNLGRRLYSGRSWSLIAGLSLLIIARILPTSATAPTDLELPDAHRATNTAALERRLDYSGWLAGGKLYLEAQAKHHRGRTMILGSIRPYAGELNWGTYGEDSVLFNLKLLDADGFVLEAVKIRVSNLVRVSGASREFESYRFDQSEAMDPDQYSLVDRIDVGWTKIVTDSVDRWATETPGFTDEVSRVRASITPKP